MEQRINGNSTSHQESIFNSTQLDKLHSLDDNTLEQLNRKYFIEVIKLVLKKYE